MMLGGCGRWGIVEILLEMPDCMIAVNRGVLILSRGLDGGFERIVVTKRCLG